MMDISVSRESLPYRKNCEGYFLYRHEYVLARDTGKGFIEFPGGGVDEGETPQQAVVREAREEVGAVVGEVVPIGKIYFNWGEDWARTAKQRARYKIFRGEEMSFFVGKVMRLEAPDGDGDEAGWSGKKYMKIEDVLEKIREGEPFGEDVREYRAKQIDSLQKIRQLLK